MKTKQHELYKQPDLWIPLKPGTVIKGSFPYQNASGKVDDQPHYWLVLNDNGPETVDMVMSTTLHCDKENKDRASMFYHPNNSTYTEEILFGDTYPLGADGRRVGICFDTGLTIPKEIIYRQSCIVAEYGKLMDPNTRKRIYKGVADTMMEVNDGVMHDPYDTENRDYRPESDFKPKKDPETSKQKWDHKIQATMLKAQMLQQNANPEIEYPR